MSVHMCTHKLMCDCTAGTGYGFYDCTFLSCTLQLQTQFSCKKLLVIFRSYESVAGVGFSFSFC